MPTLDWIGKSEMLQRHQRILYRLIHCDDKLSFGEAGEGNLLVQGDNLEALKALLPYYAGRVKCIFIDPPYNTGNEGWVYNDNMNSAEAKDWIGKVVGDMHEDHTRDDKWLCMMYPRLYLLRQLLREDGVIFVSIDDNAVMHLRYMMDEIFGVSNYLGTFVWKRRASSAMADKMLSVDHEYVLCYQQGKFTGFSGVQKDYANYNNPDDDPRGEWVSGDPTVGMVKEQRPNQYYDVVDPETGRHYPANPSRVWAYIPETMLRMIEEGRIIFPKEEGKRPLVKRYKNELRSSTNPISTWIRSTSEKPDEDEETSLVVGMNAEGTRTIQQIFGRAAFNYSKPLSLACALIRSCTEDGDIVLDTFAGSATTGHAVLQLNKEDGMKRRFILVEMDENICRDITAERLRKVIENDSNGLISGGGFRYCYLGEPLFDEEESICTNVQYRDLAHHIFFTETGQPLPKAVHKDTPRIGEADGVAYYLLWEGAEGESVLDMQTLRVLQPFDGIRTVYADGCSIPKSRLSQSNIVFKQIPYEVRSR